VALLAAATAPVLAALAMGAGTSSAAGVESSYSSPGWVSAHSVAIANAPTTDVFSQSSQQVAAIGFDKLSLYASPASNQTQVVTVTNTVKGCSSNLGLLYAYQCGIEGSRTAAWYVRPGAWATVADKSPLDVAFYTAGHIYFAQLTVTWRTTSGALLGQIVVDYTARATCSAGRRGAATWATPGTGATSSRTCGSPPHGNSTRRAARAALSR
jgi:hypothetical protein